MADDLQELVFLGSPSGTWPRPSPDWSRHGARTPPVNQVNGGTAVADLHTAARCYAALLIERPP